MIFFWLKFISPCISSELAWTCGLCQGKMNVENNACKCIRAVMKKEFEILYFKSNKTTWLGHVGGWGCKTSSIWIQWKFQIHHWFCWLCDRKQCCSLPKGKGQIGNFHTRQGRWTYRLCSSPLKLKLRKTRMCIHNESWTPKFYRDIKWRKADTF